MTTIAKLPRLAAFSVTAALFLSWAAVSSDWVTRIGFLCITALNIWGALRED